ncbi:MAG: FAD-dependent thymidylate synthase [Sulfuricurvum sp.]
MIEHMGVKYSLPKVTLLQHSGIGVAEVAARTCYDSFGGSENSAISSLSSGIDIDEINAIENSELLKDLAWTYFHHSILEHASLSYLVRGTSRGVLQEHARHRLQAISVRSTRYTMSSLINAYVASRGDVSFFAKKIKDLDMLITLDDEYNTIEIEMIFNKLKWQHSKLENFYEVAVAKSSLELLSIESSEELYEALEAGKKKRNVGDAFKHIVSDNFKVDMVVTFNIRSLKNYFTLRDSGSAYFLIRHLARAMKEATPQKYLDLIIKG